MFFDMDGLKSINDSCGHAAGDAAIRALVEVIVESVGDQGSVYRGEGGDEVIALLPKTTLSSATALSRKVLKAFGSRCLPDVHVTELTASCGIAVAESASVSPESLQAAADREMYRAKEAGRADAKRRSTIAVTGRAVELLHSA
jgi:diguanylate cyclase (GGDEF)-like protein